MPGTGRGTRAAGRPRPPRRPRRRRCRSCGRRPGSAARAGSRPRRATPSITGMPSCTVCATPANFSRSGFLDANSRARLSWPAASTLMPNRPLSRTAGSVRASLSKHTSISGGSSDSERDRVGGHPDRAFGRADGHDRDAGRQVAHHLPEAVGPDLLHRTTSRPVIPSSAWLDRVHTMRYSPRAR